MIGAAAPTAPGASPTPTERAWSPSPSGRGATAPDGPWDRDEQGRRALRDDERTVIDTSAVALDGHGGGDGAMLDDLVARLAWLRDGGEGSAGAAQTELSDALDSHLIAFAAEESRHERRLVELTGR